MSDPLRMPAITFTDAEFNLILEGLGKLPAEKSFNLIISLVKLAQEEQARRRAPPLDDEEPF